MTSARDVTDTDPPPGRADAVDGRHLRRINGRRAVMDAAIDLRLAGVDPTVESLCAAAGISAATLYRYFATLDELRDETIRRWFERTDHLFAIPDIGEGARDERIRRFVAARDRLHRETAPMARFSRRRTADVDALAATLERVRATLGDQTAQHFAPELAPLPRRRRTERVGAIAALTSFESWDQLAALGDANRRRAVRDAVDALLPTP